MAQVDDAASLAIAIQTALGRSFDRVALRRYAVDRFGTAAAAERLGALYDRVVDVARSSAVDATTQEHARRDNAPNYLESAAAGATS